MRALPTYRLQLYRNFKALESNDFQGIARFYEQHEAAIASLELEEYFDCTLAYTLALFENGDYGKHLVMCDRLLEFIIAENIRTWGGEDVYTLLLFKKAAAFYQQHEFQKSAYILRELIKIKPRHPLAVRLLQRCLLQRRPEWLMHTRAAAVALFLLAAAAVALEILMVQPLFPSWYRASLWLHNALFAAGAGVWIVGECLHAWRSRKTARVFAQNAIKEQIRRASAT